MQFNLLRMLSGASLSAFSASVQARARDAAALAPVRPIRGDAEARAELSVPRPASGALRLAPGPAQSAPDRPLPRGSLLDLSV